MRKNLKKFASLALTAAMTLSLPAFAFAEAESEAIESIEAEELISEAAEAAEELVSDAVQEAEELVSDAAQAAEELASDAAQAVEEAVSGAEEAVSQAAEAAEEAVSQAVEAAEEAVSQAAEAEEEPEEEKEPFAYLMFANSDWSKQYWGADAEGLTPLNADVTEAGEYTVGLTFDEPSAGLAFAAIGVDNGEFAFPNYTIEVNAIRVNGEEIEFSKGYTSSDDGITTRMNLYNEWVAELPEDARSFDADLEEAAPIILDPAAFESVENIEVDFTYHKYMLDTAYIMYANSDWSKQYWGGEADEGIQPVNADIDGYGLYSVSLEFDEPAQGLAFAGVGITKGELTYPKATMTLSSIKVNGEEIEFGTGYTTSDDGITTRVNLYNEWVTDLPEDARGFDPAFQEASPIIVDPAAFESVESIEVEFLLEPAREEAYIMFANSDWSKQYWGEEAGEGMQIEDPMISEPGVYTAKITFDEPSEGIAFAAIGIANGEESFNGYFIDILEILVNDEPIEVGKGYTSSDDGVVTRENIYNEWVTELPADARRKDGDLEGASAIIVDPAAFESVESIEVTFAFIYGKPIQKDEGAPMSEEEAAELQAVDYNAYIGVQTENYIFRNAWNDTYGRDDAENEGFFSRLTGWDADNNAVDYGGSFEDALLTAEGEYTVSLTTGEMGFGTDSFFRLLFVSTELPSKLVKDGFVTIDNVRTKIGDAATQTYTDVDTSGDYVRIVIIDEYNRSEDPFGYTMPGADTTISITFDVTGLTE